MRRKRHQHRGAATVEFALVLPLLLLLMLGCIEFGQLIRLKQRITTASAVAARHAVTDNTSVEEIRFAANLAFWGPKQPNNPYNWDNINYPSPDALRVELSDLSVSSGQPVKVSLTVNFQDALWPPMLGKLLPPTVTATTVMAKEGV